MLTFKKRRFVESTQSVNCRLIHGLFGWPPLESHWNLIGVQLKSPYDLISLWASPFDYFQLPRIRYILPNYLALINSLQVTTSFEVARLLNRLSSLIV